MKVRLHLKDPDGVWDSVKEAVDDSLADLKCDADEKESVRETRMEKTWDKLKKWVQYKEYVTVEIDTDAGTAVVIPQNDR